MRWSPVLSVLVGCLAAMAVPAAALGAAPPQAPAAAAAAQKPYEQLSPAEQAQRETWRKALLLTVRPGKGCFTATYPEKTWRQVACLPSTPHKLFLPHAGGASQLATVGGAGPDFSATVTGHISSAEGSFDHANGITSSGSYSLQLNTAPFLTSTCSGSPNNTSSLNTGCRGWEQFVYESSGGGFIQYWILDFGPAGTVCPVPQHVGCAAGLSYSDGWCPVNLPLFTGDPNPIQCVINAVNQPSAAARDMPLVGNVKVAGAAGDSITVTVSGAASTATGDNRFPDLGTQWNEAEFNVFGGGNSANANFNSGSDIRVRTEVLSGSNAGPGCDLRTFTGESTNLTLDNTPPTSVTAAPGPALVFEERYPPLAGAAASCLDAVSLGDTHLTTFGGLLYDFQAMGDFLLADTGRDFVVQTRQVSGKPNWPDADVNNAVAVGTGRDRVAICLPDRVVVDGRPTEVSGEHALQLPGGGTVSRKANSYTVIGTSGDSMRAEMLGDHIDVSVGLGKWPSTVRGLLADANGVVGKIQTQDGQVLTANLTQDGPFLRGTFPFDDLYHAYADSWRVSPRASLLSDCGEAKEVGIAKAPFYATDLDAGLAQHARTVCATAGVKAGPLLEACALDVAVIGKDEAANVYVNTRAPVAVATIVTGGGGLSGLGGHGWPTKSWCCVLVVILLLLGSILLAIFGKSAQGPLHILKWLVVIASWLLALYCLVLYLGLFGP